MKGAIVIGCLALLSAGSVEAEIVVGPWTFQDGAFADEAIQLEPGELLLFGTPTPVDLNDALTDFSPHQGLINIGEPDRANLFQLNFDAPFILSADGPDFVFFDAQFSADAYAIAVRPRNEGFTEFLAFPEGAFVATGAIGPFQGVDLGFLFGLPVELDDYGLPVGTVVDSIRFRSLIGDDGSQGDPVMVGALNVPEPATLLLMVLGGVWAIRRRRPRHC